MIPYLNYEKQFSFYSIVHIAILIFNKKQTEQKNKSEKKTQERTFYD